MPPIFITHPQGSPEWLAARCGKLTASRMADALDTLKSGAEGAKRAALKIELLTERLTGKPTEVFETFAMRQGRELEPIAREAFSAATFTEVSQCGLVLHADIPDFGASPDGMIADDGILEIKCPQPTTHMKWLMDDCTPEQHKPQMLAQMACLQRTWGMFVSFCPSFPEPHNLLIVRYHPTEKQILQVAESADKFLGELKTMELKFKEEQK